MILFKACDAGTPLESLKRRRNWAAWTITIWLLSLVAMAEGMASVIFFHGAKFEVVLMIVAQVISTLTTLPAIILMPMVGEYERELASRGELGEGYVPVHRRIPRYILRAMIFFAVAITAANWFK
jgi:hypothetical protein